MTDEFLVKVESVNAPALSPHEGRGTTPLKLNGWLSFVGLVLLTSYWIFDVVNWPDMARVCYFALLASCLGTVIYFILGLVYRGVENLRFTPYGVWIGVFERFLFVFAICVGFVALPLFWVGLKVGVQSNKWKDGINARDPLDAYLIYCLISVFIGYFAAWCALGAPVNLSEIWKLTRS